MKTQKLSLHDFEAVETVELLQIKGGKTPPGYIVKWEDAPRNDGVGGGCAGDDNGFGGTFDADEVVVYGNSSSGSGTPMFNQQTGSWQHSHCQGCYAVNRITDGHDSYQEHNLCLGNY